jgi:hypothetical protein
MLDKAGNDDATRQLAEIDILQKLLEAREQSLRLAHSALLSELELMSAAFTPGAFEEVQRVIEERSGKMESHHRVEFHSIAIILAQRIIIRAQNTPDR